MIIPRVYITAMLALGLLLLPGAAPAERIQRSTDQQGTIYIGNPKTAKPEKTGEEKANPAGPEKAPGKKGKTGEVSAPPEPAAPAPPPPGLLPSHSRRTRFGPGGEVIPHPKSPLLSPSPTAPPLSRPGAASPEAPPARPERPSSPESQ